MSSNKKSHQKIKIKINNSRGGIGFCGLLTITFIVLKLLGIIEWSWLLVLSPILIPILLVLLVLSIILIYISIKEKKARNKHERL